MIDYVAGRRTYGALRRDVLLRSPGTAIRLAWKYFVRQKDEDKRQQELPS